jgi:Flp pilus assembly protein TadG
MARLVNLIKPSDTSTKVYLTWEENSNTASASVPVATNSTRGAIQLPPSNGNQYVMINGNWVSV